MTRPIDGETWIPASEVRRILGCGDIAIAELVAAGRIAKRKLSRSRPRYLKADVRRVLAESIKPAV